VVSARSTGESAPAAVVKIRFCNRSAQALDVRGYRLTWPGGTFGAEPGDLRLSPGQDAERTVRVEARHGDVAALLQRTAEARVEITRVAGGSLPTGGSR
jgi:hypothetical protein